MEEIIKICIYNNSENSYIIPSKNGTCKSLDNMKLYGSFYAVSPNFHPIPQGMLLIGIKDTTESLSITTDVELIYDPFNYQDGITKFISWIEPVPYSTPLYIFTNGDKISASFSNIIPIGYQSLNNPLYVLIDPRININRIPSFTNNTFKIVNNEPQFLFSKYQGRCIPNPNGITLRECTQSKNSLLHANTQPSLLNELQFIYGDKKESYTINTFLSVFFVIIFVIFLIIFVIKIEKKKR
jgi:hypothetical protein